ncbi:Mitochondrial copper homeostasis protein [Hanseniaspora vineae]
MPEQTSTTSQTSGQTPTNSDNNNIDITIKNVTQSDEAPKIEIVETEKSKVDFAKNKKYQYYPDKPDSSLNKMKFVVKGASQFYDPCEESSKMSFKCLELNDYDRDMCRQYFDAYRECKKQWLSHRRSNGNQWK